MKLRPLILLTSVIGACGALLLAADLYRRLKEAEAAAAIANSAVRDDSVLVFGMYHTLGLLSLAFFFLATFLIFLSGSNETERAAAARPVHSESTPIPAVPAAAHDIPIEVKPIHIVAAEGIEPPVSETVSDNHFARPDSDIPPDNQTPEV